MKRLKVKNCVCRTGVNYFVMQSKIHLQFKVILINQDQVEHAGLELTQEDDK